MTVLAHNPLHVCVEGGKSMVQEVFFLLFEYNELDRK